MKETSRKYLTKFLKYVTSHIIGTVMSLVLGFIILATWHDYLQPMTSDIFGWLQANWRVLQDAFQSGFVRGTPFRNTLGNWAVAWELGGQPFIHIVIHYAFASIFFLGSFSGLIYLVRQYHKFKRLKAIFTYLKHPSSFWKYVSFRIVVALTLMSLVGITGMLINPNLIVPAEPSKNYLGVEIGLSSAVEITITRYAIMRIDPPVLEKNNMTGQFCCIIMSPENATWGVSDIVESTILLNNETHPCSASVHSDSNGTASMLAQFNKESLRYVFEDASFLELGNVTLDINGRLKNGDYFAGSSQLKIET